MSGTTPPRPKPPLIARAIWKIPLIAGPRLATATAAQLEKQQERTRARADRLGPSTHQRVIDGPAGDITLRIHTTSAEALAKRAVIVHFHGGGWVSGSPREADFICSTVAEGTGAIVVSVDYRLAPRNRYPAGLDDCYAALVWVTEHAAELGGDATRLGLLGESAGGNLAAAVSLLARDRGGPTIRHQGLLYPATDASMTAPSHRTNANAPWLTAAGVRNAYHHYLPEDANPWNRGSPLCTQQITRASRPRRSSWPAMIRSTTRATCTPSACGRPTSPWTCSTTPAWCTVSRTSPICSAKQPPPWARS